MAYVLAQLRRLAGVVAAGGGGGGGSTAGEAIGLLLALTKAS